MSIDLTQQALNALADAGLGNDTPAEAYVIGYTQGHNDALALAIRIEQAITATPLTPDELDLLALALWEANGERPTVYESGKRIADRELELWFSTRPSKTKTALAVCRPCPVIGECREWADGHSRINGYPLQGIWGGRQYGVMSRQRKDRK